MSSNAAFLSPKTGGMVAGFMAALVLASPVTAQDDGAVTETEETQSAAEEAPPQQRRRQFSGINLTVTVPKDESDLLLEQDCEEEADAARIANEIVVCRQLGEATDGSWNKEAWERSYAERTQGEQPVDVAGGGIFSGKATIGGMCLIPPCPPEAALMIDVEALPEAPEGSDADRIARGLPPLGRDPEPTAEEIAERRRALGLETPPVPGGQ